MPASNIDFSSLTHIIHFAVVPNGDGTLDTQANSLSVANSSDVVAHAHAAGRKVILCVGGGDTETLFQGATSAANLPKFINSLTNLMATRGYDGLDLDWEPLPAADAQQYTNLVNGLRAALDSFPQRKLLTAAVGAYPPYGDSATAQYLLFAGLQNKFDQINIMTYDLSGPYDGWVTWFNSPLYDGGSRFSGGGNLLPSVDGSVNNFITNGVAPAKLGVGLAFYGFLWTGGSSASITQPRQGWTNAPTVTAVRYSTIMAEYYQSNFYHWDAKAQAAYLSVTNANPAANAFISYDDLRTCQAKVSYARNHGLGGVMIWELAQDHSSGKASPLVQALQQALATPGKLSLQRTSNQVNLAFSSIALGSYRIEWFSNLSSGTWNTLSITNVPGAGGVLQTTDPGAMTNQRFYRIQTPP